jgi:hypothetical protein
MLLAVVALQRFPDRLGVRFDPTIPQIGERFRVAFTQEDRVEDAQPGLAGEIAEDVMELEFIWVNAFCMCWVCVAVIVTSVSR